MKSRLLSIVCAGIWWVTPVFAQQFGPFPDATSIFVDVDNTTGVEDGSQEHPFNNVQEGINVATNGDVVGVAPGLYAEIFGPSLTPNYVIDGLQDFSLVGMGPGQTIIRGDHSFSLIRVQNGSSALIRGFTIEEGGRIQNSEGGGIQIIGQLAPTSLIVENVVLQDNVAVNGGAIATSGDVRLDLTNVIIADNQASNCCGGVIIRGTNSTVNAAFTNVTVTGNLANFNIGGIEVERATLNLINSIVWNNSLAEVGTREPATLRVSFSDVGETLFPGPGNISTDPQFINPGARDYHLQATSPAIDAGTNTGAPSTDFEGNLRPIDGDGDGIATTDIGAYEFVPEGPFGVTIDIKPGNKRNVINPRAKGGIWVATFSDTNPDSPFDPSSQVDIPTVEFGPDGATATRHKVKDINKDGLGDLLLRFKIPATGIACGDTEATLSGETFDGQSFSGTDFLKTVGCKPKKHHKKKYHKKHHDDDHKRR